MMRKRKKNTRQRGTWTYGWGSKKKHRGAGNRGGRGLAGTGKRADQMKPSYWEEPYFGSHGFTTKSGNPNLKSINTLVLQNHIDSYVKEGKAKFDGKTYDVDLSKLGYDVLLSKGTITKKFHIKVRKASENVMKKVQNSGGKIEILAQVRETVNSEKNIKAKQVTK